MILLAIRGPELQVSSFRYFPHEDALAQFVKEHPEGITISYPRFSILHKWPSWHAYKVFDDGTECQPLTLNEYRTIGMRPINKSSRA